MKKVLAAVVLGAVVMIAASGVTAGDKRESGQIGGCLTDARSGLPLAFAWVAVTENNFGAETDSSGCFSITGLAPGVYHLIVTHPDLGSVQGLPELVVSVKKGGTANVTLALALMEQESSSKAGKLSGETRERPSASTSDLGVLLVPQVRREPNQDKSEASKGGFDNYQSYPPAGSTRLFVPDIVPNPPDMFFRDYGTNGFVDTRRDRFSTFALDVDDASFNLARRYLLDGLMPPQDAVRIEEFINHFEYDYNVPADETFRVFTEITNSPFESNKHIMKVAVKGREIDRSDRRPMNITFVIDVSGSMASGNRFQLVRESIKALVRQLNGLDRVGIVAYGSNAYVALEPISADRQREIFRTMERLTPGGSTYAEAGIRMGYEMANRQFVNGHNNVVILCSDGVANVGQTSPDAIMTDISRFARRGLTMSTFGYGMGNYNDVLLEQLAQKGNGRYAYINDLSEIQRVFVDEFVGTLQVLARDVKIQIEFNPETVRAYRLLGYENRDVADHRFRDNRQDGGEVGAGDEVTAVYEMELASKSRQGKIATVFVRWKNADGTEVFELSRDAIMNKHFSSFDNSRPELRLAIVAGRFAEMLKGTPYASRTSFEELFRIAEPLRRELPGEQTDDLVDLIRRASSLTDRHAWEEDNDLYFGNYKR
jgi:Ca-activated chloride channel family protein